MSDDKSIIDQGADAAKKWIEQPANQQKAIGWLQTAWSWLKGRFSKKGK